MGLTEILVGICLPIISLSFVYFMFKYVLFGGFDSNKKNHPKEKEN